MPNPLENKSVVLGVSGSIAAYKAADLASKLTQAGALVDVVMTASSVKFIAPLTFQSITHRPAVTDIFDPKSAMGIDHVEIAERADVVVVAPATANSIAKLAWGLADDAVSTTVLATRAPVIVCPAMDGNMYDNPATQENLDRLRSRGITVAGPGRGRLASGLSGMGRLLETPEILGHVRLVLGRDGDLAGCNILVSAGGTQEAIDPVRYISNRSSGKMGYAIAEAARDRGARAVIVSAPNALPDPVDVKVVKVSTALEMRDAIAVEVEDADALIMAAAVADWRPVEVADHKMKKGAATTMTLELKVTPDILSSVGGDGLVKVGFAAESGDLETNARAKLRSKELHLIAANDITAEGSGFGGDTNRAVLFDRDGGREDLGLLPKYNAGDKILDRVAALLEKRKLR